MHLTGWDGGLGKSMTSEAIQGSQIDQRAHLEKLNLETKY